MILAVRAMRRDQRLRISPDKMPDASRSTTAFLRLERKDIEGASIVGKHDPARFDVDVDLRRPAVFERVEGAFDKQIPDRVRNVLPPDFRHATEPYHIADAPGEIGGVGDQLQGFFGKGQIQGSVFVECDLTTFTMGQIGSEFGDLPPCSKHLDRVRPFVGVDHFAVPET
jgi:hypothetical protein